MSSHKNLLAAKSALGLSTGDGGGEEKSLRSSVGSHQSGSASTFRSASASRVSGAASGAGGRSTSAGRVSAAAAARDRYGDRSVAGTIASSRSGSTARTKHSKRSFIHDLSSSARREARGYGDSDDTFLGAASAASRRSRLEERRAERMAGAERMMLGRRDSAGTAGTLGGNSYGGTLASGYSSARRSRPSLLAPSLAPSHPSTRTGATPNVSMHESVDASTVDEGSDMDSFTAKPTAGTVAGSTVGESRAGTLARSLGSRGSQGSFGYIGTVNSHSRATGQHAGGSRASGGLNRRGSGGSRFLEKKSSMGSTGSNTDPGFGVSSSTFNNAYESKLGNLPGQMQMQQGMGDDGTSSWMDGTASLMDGGQSIVSGSNSLLGEWPPTPSVASQATPHTQGLPPQQQMQQHQPQHLQQQQLQPQQTEFVPQRFDEMRALLSAITPLQLEALMLEIFKGASGPPAGWDDVSTKAKSKNFRKDAYLSEMSLDELRRFVEDKNMPAIAACGDCDEALDVIAIEFERLVSRHQNGGDDGTIEGTVEGTVGSGMGSLQNSVQNSFAASFVSGSSTTTSHMADEGANLRRSLRACSLPELRLVAERLQLDHANCPGKAELIAMIEHSMPDVSTQGGGSSIGDSQTFEDAGEASLPETTVGEESQEQRVALQRYHHMHGPEGGPHHPDQQQYEGHPSQQPQMEEPGRRVKFTSDCKEDTSHLIPKREKGGSWKTFVVAPEPGAAPPSDADVEYGGEDIDTARPLFHSHDGMEGYEEGEGRRGRRRRRSFEEEMTSHGRRRRRKWTLPKFMERIPMPEQVPEMPFRGNRRMVLGVAVLLAVVIGLSVGLTKDKGGGEVDVLFPDPNDPFFTGNGFRNPFAASKAEMPSARPSMAASDVSEDYPSHNAGGSSSSVSAPSSPSLSSTSGLASFLQLPTTKPVAATVVPSTASPSSPVTYVKKATAVPSPASSGESFATISPTPQPIVTFEVPITPSPVTNQPTEGQVVPDTNSPTPLSPYPLNGPFDESGLRLILYGVGELNHMGRTQWKMLTAAYVEQFFNKEGVGDDAIQNIVFDVVCSIDIEDEVLLGQDGLIVTFTMTISYRTFSSFIQADTVAERPFFDEGIRAGYVQFLVDNNAVSHIGDISVVSPTFRGNDIPDPPEGLEMGTDTPTLSPLFQIPDVPAPEPTTERPTDYPITPAPVEPEETPQPTPSPTEGATPQPTPSPTEGETPEPSNKPTTAKPSKSPTAQPTIPAPTPETYYPTPSSLLSAYPTFAPIGEDLTPATAANVIFTPEPTLKPTPHPTKQTTLPPTHAPSSEPTREPTTDSPTDFCDTPVNEPICPFLGEFECCRPMCAWDSTAGRCLFLDESSNTKVEWLGEFEVGQTHVFKAEGETRHAPRIIAHRELELLFTPGRARRLDVSGTPTSEMIQSLGTAYILREGVPVLDASAQRLLDGSGTVFSLPSSTPDISIVIDLDSLRLVEGVSILLNGDTSLTSARVALHYDDGRNEEEDEGFHLPDSDWTWHNFEPSIAGGLEGEISIAIASTQARYVMIRMESRGTNHWGFGHIEIVGNTDGLALNPSADPWSIDPTISSRTFAPSDADTVRVAVYSPNGELIGSMKARDPTLQRDILERHLAFVDIAPYSDSIWSATLPFEWVEEGNSVVIGCVDEGRPAELLMKRLELVNLAQFSEHTITRTKLAIFGTKSDLASLDSSTHPARRIARDLYGVMPVAELKWVDTDVWHLPYVVVKGTDGPVLVNSEEERRNATGEGSEISWSVMKNFLTIRHSLANTGHGFSATSEEGANSPYNSGTSVFMGWSLSEQNEAGGWEWEDLGYWDTLAAAAWTGWCAMKAGDECSNYFVHEIGHAMTMQHFDAGAAAKWGIKDEYPQDGKHMAHHPWGYDAATRQFRTWFDPFQGDGKLDPLNGAGEGPTSEQCFSQYTPYQAKKAQEWASSTPALLSASSSNVPKDGAYKFDASSRSYSLLEGTMLTDAVGDAAMEPEQVGVPVITLVGTIGKYPDVCQTYPALRSWSGNTFQLPDPFSAGLPSAFSGAAHYVEVKFEDGSTVRGLIAAGNDLAESSLKFFSFNVALSRRPKSVSLYRFTDSSYPNLTYESNAELLHLRPTELPPDDPLSGLPPLTTVGRGWLGHSSDIMLNRFCETSDDCNSDQYSIEWRSTVGSDSILYSSTLAPEPQQMLGATVFKVPAVREFDSAEYEITVLATRFFNGDLGSSPLLTTSPSDGDGSSNIDATHGIRIVAPWEMNGSLPAGTYRSVPGALAITASNIDGNDQFLNLHISLNLGTVTEAPTRSPTKKPSPGPTQSPVEIRYYIDWNTFTCVTDGESTEWAPAHISKEDCCYEHMAYDFPMCMSGGE